MAVAIIYPTAIDYADWRLIGVGNGVTALSDGNPGTYYDNYQPNIVPRTIQMHSTASKPANMVGATITQVRLQFTGLQTQASVGDFSGFIQAGVTGQSNFAIPDGSTSPFVDVTAYKVWTDADFYVATTKWGISHAGNADSATLYRSVTECYLEVTYTPPSAPVAAFTVSTTTGTSPLSVQFTDQGTNSPTSWLWTFGDSNTSAAQHPLYVYTTVGTYTVTLTETNGGGSDDISTASLITVLTAAAPVAAEFNASPLSGLQNLGVQFTDYSTGTPAPNAWLWSFGDSSTATTQHPLHVYTTVGTYTVTLTATNGTPTTDTETKASFITVENGKPVPLAEASTTTGVRPLTVQFTGSATNALPSEWFWDFGDSSNSAAQSPIHVYSTVGTYTPILTVTNAIGSATDTVGPITVGFSTITAGFTAAPLMGYVPLTVRFTDESSGDVNSWAWAFGDGEFDFEHQHPVHVYETIPVAAASQTITQESQSYPSALADGLTNYWKMEETTGTGDRIDFIDSDDLTPTVSLNQVAGKNDFGVQLPLDAVLRKVSGFSWAAPFSVSCWFSISATNDASALWTNFALLRSVTLSVNPNVLSLEVTGSSTTNGSTTLSAGVFYHVVVTFDGVTTYKVYLNGVLEFTHVGPAALSDGAGFGLTSGGASTHTFDEVGVYNLSLSQERVTALYNLGAGLFFNPLDTTDTETSASLVCAMAPDRTWGFFFEELKYQLMEPVYELDVCEGFDAYGGMSKAVNLTHKRIQRFVLETGALRKEATLSAAAANSEDFPLPTDLIELIRLEVDGVPYYKSDPYQRDMDSALNYYIENDALTVTIPGTFGATPAVKVWYTYVPAAPSVPAPCTCPSTPGSGPWPNFPLPYVLWWIIRYGVMADMLNQAGERNDPERAGELDKLFTAGVGIFNLLYRGWD